MKRLLILIPLLLACGPFFYQAPPSLVHYPQRIATKNWRELLSETQPGNQESRAELLAELQVFAREIPSLEKQARLEKTKDFITRNREGHFAISVANFLLELREMLELEISDKDLESYLKWRSHQLPSPSAPNPPVKDWRKSEAEFQKAFKKYRSELFDFLTSHDERIESASPALKPFEIIQRAGMYFRNGYPDLAASDFEDVIRSFPKHPRAEVSRFMLGRTALQSVRKLKRNDFDHQNDFHKTRNALITKTKDAFESYLEKHPQGRFANDAYGWLGGLARDQKNLHRALNLQLQRLETKSTREVTAAVLRECDQIFTNSVGKEWFDYERLSAHPIIARLFIAHALDPSARRLFKSRYGKEDGDRGSLDFLQRRVIAPGPDVAKSLSQLGAAMTKRDAPHDDTSLLIVGWAAARQGDHAQALTIFNLALRQKTTDELLHARAVALARLDRNKEAAATFQKLIANFPKSPLSIHSQFDLAHALLHSQNAGQAFLIFHKLDRQRKSGTSVPASLHLPTQISQWSESILQFSPLPELQETLTRLPVNHPSHQILRRAISMRALSREDFKTARQLIVPVSTNRIHHSDRYRPSNYFDLTLERWKSDLGPLIAARKKLTNPSLSTHEKAHLHLEIGRIWKAMRGRLTLPLRELAVLQHSEINRLDHLLHDNARHLGLDGDTIENMLISRDELSHALSHFLKATEIPASPEVTSAALEEANEALFRMAELSPYRASFASRKNHTSLSLKLVTRLRQEFPNRPETARALTYTFRPPLLLGDWMPGDRAPWIADLKLAEVFHPTNTTADNEIVAFINEQFKLSDRTKSITEIRAQLAILDQKFQTLRPGLSPKMLIDLSNSSDDLQVVAHHPGITADLFREYFLIRLNENLPTLQVDSPLAPFLDFLHRARDPNNVADWSAYLATYPDGPKSEAASLRLIRRVFRKSFPLPHVRPVFFPDAPRTTGYKHLEFSNPVSEQAPARDLLNQHRKQFPNGNYQADLNLLEAAALASKKRYPAALKVLTDILSDPSHPELYQDAALQFAELSLRLLNLEERATLVPAFQSNPDALANLRKLALGGTCLSRLRPLLPALQ